MFTFLTCDNIKLVNSVKLELSIKYCKISVPPVAWIQKNHDLVENEKMVLNCSVTGSPTPIVTWTFGRQLLN